MPWFNPEMSFASWMEFARLDVPDESYVTKIILFSWSLLVRYWSISHKGAKTQSCTKGPSCCWRLWVSVAYLIDIQHPISNFHEAWLPDPMIIACRDIRYSLSDIQLTTVFATTQRHNVDTKKPLLHLVNSSLTTDRLLHKLYPSFKNNRKVISAKLSQTHPNIVVFTHSDPCFCAICL